MRVEHETLMTVDFWRSLGRGTLILKYPPVAGEPDSQRRAVNGLILLAGEFVECPWRKAPEMTGHPVMVVQAKAGRTDAVLVGQAVFSPVLLRRQQPSVGTIESVALSTAREPSYSDLLHRHGVGEVVVRGPAGDASSRSYPALARSHLDAIHGRIGGEMLLGVKLGFSSERNRPLLTVDAVILPDRPLRRATADDGELALRLIRGARATAVVSTKSHLGMGTAGRALVAQHLLELAGAREPRAIVVAAQDDRALQSALAKFPGLAAEVADGTD